MGSDAPKKNLGASYELLKQWTDIAEADMFEELGPAAIYKTSAVLWLMLFPRLNPLSVCKMLYSTSSKQRLTSSKKTNDCLHVILTQLRFKCTTRISDHRLFNWI